MIKAPRGTRDIFGEEIFKWRRLEALLRETCAQFGAEEISTPIFEHTELFQRGVGETTDIVQKEMYHLENKSEKSLTLRPEGTAGVARAFIEHKMYAGVQPTKLYYISPNFRYERPQAGRYRQFHQFGAEVFGSYHASCDAEMISLVHYLFKKLGLQNIELRINSLGGPRCRAKYNETLKNFIGSHISELCDTCRERFEKNPLRVLDCKNPDCQAVIANAPSVLDILDKECREHFETLQLLLNDMGIPFTVDAKIVRGLDYYTRTVFEFVSTDIGAQGTVCGGGRYDGLVEECGGPATGAVGFAMGIERLLLIVEKQNAGQNIEPEKDIFIGSIGEKGFRRSQSLVYRLREAGFLAEGDTLGRSVKAQMKYADKIRAKYSVIIGDNEIETDTIKLKNMKTGEQEEIKLSEIQSRLEK